MEQILAKRLRTLLAMLCIALSFVFASGSAASVVDSVQHSTKVAHEHGLHFGFSIAADDHHADHGEVGDHDDAAGDHQPGASHHHHHHHGDAPVGALSTAVETGAAPHAVALTLGMNRSASAKGIRPGGLERPPKAFANLS